MAQLGADVEQLDQLANRFRQAADELNGIIGQVGGQVEGAWWQGADADRFRSDWNGSFRSQLNRMVQAFQEAGQQVTSQAAQQRQASGG